MGTDTLPRSSSLPALTAPVSKKYSFRKTIGYGAYGTVWAARHRDTGQEVAIKKIGARNFEQVMLAKRALRELKLLRHLHGNDNITSFIDAETNDLDPYYFNELYLVESLMEADLYQIIKSKQELSDQHYQYFIYQLLRGLKWMHSANVVHRDLKPGNLLVNSDCELRICDFGLARGVLDCESQFVNTEYVATRYYRAPEVILSPKHYSKALDMWSVGCILAELMIGRVMFRGVNYIDQLAKIFEVLGTPQDPTLMSLCSPKVLRFIQGWPRWNKMPLKKIFPNATSSALDLLDKLLIFDPAQRITAEQSLEHPYLAAYHQIEDEPNHPTPFDFSFESADTVLDIKKLIVKEIANVHKEEAELARAAQKPPSLNLGNVNQNNAANQSKGSDLNDKANASNGQGAQSESLNNLSSAQRRSLPPHVVPSPAVSAPDSDAVKESQGVSEPGSFEEELHLRELKITG